jgi:hypothetical protein
MEVMIPFKVDIPYLRVNKSELKESEWAKV